MFPHLWRKNRTKATALSNFGLPSIIFDSLKEIFFISPVPFEKKNPVTLKAEMCDGVAIINTCKQARCLYYVCGECAPLLRSRCKGINKMLSMQETLK